MWYENREVKMEVDCTSQWGSPENTGLVVERERTHGRGPRSTVWWRMSAGREGNCGCWDDCRGGGQREVRMRARRCAVSYRKADAILVIMFLNQKVFDNALRGHHGQSIAAGRTGTLTDKECPLWLLTQQFHHNLSGHRIQVKYIPHMHAHTHTHTHTEGGQLETILHRPVRNSQGLVRLS